MSDYAHRETDKILQKIETRLAKEYAQAYSESRAKLDKYLERFEDADEKMRKKLDEGKITDKQYKKWRRGKIATGRRYSALVETLAQDYSNVNAIAMGIVRGELEGVFALNANYAHYDIEQQLDMDLSFTLYDRETVANLVKNSPSLLPNPSPDAVIDVRWNKQKIRSAILQGILQGEPISEISKRLGTVVGMDKSAAVRNARTAMTGAQNAGRQQGFSDAREKGVIIKRIWIATDDRRTRHWHNELDGQETDIGEPFVNAVGKIMYPGDPAADGANIYNCRCTLGSRVVGFDKEKIRG